MSLASRERVLELSKKLEKAKAKVDTNKVLTILTTLSSIQINIALLRESGLGKKVTSIKKSQSFKHQRQIIESATALVKAWRTMAENEKRKLKKSKKKISKLKTKSSSSKDKTPSMTPPLNANSDNAVQDKQTSVDTEDTDNGFIREPNSSWKTGDERRDKMISKFIAVLKPKPDKTEYLCFCNVAAQIEQSLVDEYGQMSQGYIAKMRDLHFNLKKNKDLCDDLLFGLVTSKKLVKMTSDEMAAQSLKMQRDKDRKWKLEDARNDHGLSTDQTMTDEFKCGRCKQRKTKYSQAQTRGADEPMTTFVSCLVCGNRWRF